MRRNLLQVVCPVLVVVKDLRMTCRLFSSLLGLEHERLSCFAWAVCICLATMSTPRWRGLFGDFAWTLVNSLGTVMVLCLSVLSRVCDVGALVWLIASAWFISLMSILRVCSARLIRMFTVCSAILVAIKGPLLWLLLI